MSFLSEAAQLYKVYQQIEHQGQQGGGGGGAQQQQQQQQQQYQQQPQQQQYQYQQQQQQQYQPPQYPPHYQQQQQQQYAPPSGPPPAHHQQVSYTPPLGPPPQVDSNGHAVFKYSTCTGARKALLIGINYTNSNNRLSGCINDVHNVKRMLETKFGYEAGDMVILTDDQADPRSQPTKANIVRAMQWLVNGAQRNDSLFLHYSGHGTVTAAFDADDIYGHAEAICPVDFQTAGLIVDDDMHDILVSPLPAGCRLTAIFDSCHSGSAVDLPYAYSTKGTIKSPNLLANATPQLLNAGLAALQGADASALFTLFGAAKDAYHTKTAVELARKTKIAQADVICWGGSKDDQTSADAVEEGAATGAMSYAFVRVVDTHPHASYQQFLVGLREEMLRGGYSQKPQLSACHPIDTSLEFVM